tara:strand:+ start:43 stop:426 length:384 start_codon:yes stop_codon:yes gene_type:complete
MGEFKKEKHNPIKLIKTFWPNANVEHITYDPKLKKGEYNIIRQCGGDGTLAFTFEMLQKGLIDIVNGRSFFKKTEPDWDKVKYIKYTVGDMKHATVYGMIKLKCSKTQKYTGQKERIRMPVKCEYVY